jgi:hypothetical protein
LVLSLVWIWGVGSVLAIIFGFIGRRQIRESGNTQGGDGLAIAGIVIGIAGLVGAILATVALAVFTAGVTNTFVNGIRGAEIASCRAEAKSVLTAIEAYHAQNGANATVPSAWSASTYTSNFSPLTSGANNGPYLREAPSTSNYVIEYDSAGHVWVEGPGVYDSSYNSGRDFDLNGNACNVAF